MVGLTRKICPLPRSRDRLYGRFDVKTLKELPRARRELPNLRGIRYKKRMGRYVPPTEQLVTEILVADIKRSVRFYLELGFTLLRDGGDFVELTWEEHRLFLAELSAFRDAAGAETPPRPKFPRANVRVMVPNVDECWARVQKLGAEVVIPIADRYYGLRDFTIADPDGFGIRFASALEGR